MTVKVNVKVDLKGVPVKTSRMTKLGQYALVNQVHADMDPYIPRLSSDLANQSTVALDDKSIIYNVPYAKKQFYVPHFNYTKPGTGPRWDLKAKAIHGGSWARITKKAMR